MGKVSLLKNDHDVQDMPEQKMYPHRLLVLCIPLPGSPAGLPWTGSPCDTSADLPPWSRFSRSVSPLPLSHVVSSCALPNIHPLSPPRTPCPVTVPSVAPGRRYPLPSPVARRPSPVCHLRLGPPLLAWGQTMPNIFPKLVRRPNLSNRTARIINSPWSHRGSDNVTVSLSA